VRTPRVFSADQMKSWDAQTEFRAGAWTQARPMSRPGINLLQRISTAWMVFTGAADVLIWQEITRRTHEQD